MKSVYWLVSYTFLKTQSIHNQAAFIIELNVTSGDKATSSSHTRFILLFCVISRSELQERLSLLAQVSII